jgi:hypothetical protein
VKNYSRKQFIKLSALAGASVTLSACGLNSGENNQNKQPLADTETPTKVDGPAPSIKLDLVDKNDARYDILRKGFNTRIDKHPQLIAVCTSTEEVAAAVRYAGKSSLPIAVKSGGHSMEGFSCNDDGFVINLSQMNHIEMLDDNNIKAGPGCILSQLYDTILPNGRILPAGSCATVGLGGLTLGGGYGLFARKYGLTCDHLIEATMVDGQGNIHTTNSDAELLWALKGGGNGNFGIVTEMVFRTQAAPPTLQAHYFKARKLTPEKAASILQIWMELSPLLPDTCFSGFVLNGSTLNILITNYDANNTELPALLQKLSEYTDTFHSSKWGKLDKMLRNYYGVGKPLYFRNSSAGFFESYKDIAPFISQVFEKTINIPGMIYQVNTMGGKIKDTTFEKQSSYPHRAFDFVSELQGYSNNPSQNERIAQATTDILNLTAENGINTQYVNYCSLEFGNWENAYYGENYSRLQSIKRKYDPANHISHPQSIKI